MSKTLRFALAAMLCGAVPAAAQSPEEQFAEALALFRPYGADFDGMWAMHAQITRGLSGRWMRGAQLLLGKGQTTLAPELLKRSCMTVGTEIVAEDFTISMTLTYKIKKTGATGQVVTRYYDRGGGIYTFATDPEAFLTRLGIRGDSDNSIPPSTRYMALMQQSGIAHLYRPSPDVLVVVPIAGQADLFVRCPP